LLTPLTHPTSTVTSFSGLTLVDGETRALAAVDLVAA